MSELQAVNRKPTAAEVAAANRRSKAFDASKKAKLMSNQAAFGKAMGGAAAQRGKDPLLTAKPSSYKKGGKVQKTGTAKVHKGEVVLTKKQAKKPAIKKAMKKK